MASLTDQIGSTNSGREIINPGPANPSFIGALAGAARQVVPGLAQVGEERAQKRAGDALDQSAQIIRDRLVGRTEAALAPPQVAAEFVQSGPVAISSELEGSGLPSDAVSVAADLRRAQAAANQGRVSRAAVDMRVNQSVDELFAKFPDQRAEISQFMLSQGFNHYMYRAEIEDRARVEAEASAALNADVAPATYAQQNGLATPDMSLPQQAAIGREAMARKARADALEARATAAREDRRLSNEERDFEQKQVGAETISVLTEEINASVDPVLRQSEALLSAAGTDAERQQLLGGTKIQLQAYLGGQRRAAIARIAAVGGADVSTNIASINTMFDNYEQSMEALYTESFQANTRSLRNMQSWLGINAQQAAPAYSRLVALLGSNQAANAVFDSPDGSLPFTPEAQTALTNEFRNFDPTTERGTLTMARLVGFLRGEVGFKDLQANEAATYISANGRALNANQQQVLEGNEAAVRPWATNYANVAEAAVELAPTTAAPASLRRAVDQIEGPGATRALSVLNTQDPTYGRAIAQASRSGATNLMIVARTQLQRLTQDSPYTLQWNGSSTQGGAYELRFTRQDYDRWVARQGASTEGATGEYPSGNPAVRTYEQMRTQIPQNLSDLVYTTNKALNHLTATSGYTDELPSGLTNRQVRNYYATGALPAGVTRPESGGPTGDVAFERQVQEFEASLKGQIGVNLERGLPASGSDLDWVVRTVYGEAANEGRQGRQEVARVIENRRRAGTFGGSTYRDVVRAPNQFEPWNNPDARRRMESLDRNSEQYKAIEAEVREALEGDTGDFTHFYAPRAQRALGRNAPRWDDGSGRDIGNHRFFRNPDRNND